ncbi:MAG: cell division protein FtsZ [Tannerella sp.]|jgi:cell division protein FtsZ|nr:cell division protein FtsZ [Tannerella sp.]
MEHGMKPDHDIPADTQKIIKVVGVGGGGGNAVTHMYRQGIHDVSFVLCNTDEQAMKHSDVPLKICLGRTITRGLGAGNRPERAMAAAKESEGEIRDMFCDGTQMAFITAGMGGGTGTGAAPVIAKIAKEMDILTVGIVTIPFVFEGRPKILQALAGVEEMNRGVDALLVVNNERLYDIYKDLTIRDAFAKADDTLAIAAKSIAEIITLPGIINLDFADVRTTMKDGGVALMSNGYGEGEGRLEKAIADAFKSPLLNNSNIFNARKILFNISSGRDEEVSVDEMTYMTEFMSRFGEDIEVIWGVAIDDSLERKIKFTVLATGFNLADDAPDDVVPPDDGRERTEEEILRYQEYLIWKYYGDLLAARRPEPDVALLTFDEMKNESIVKIMEDNPAYSRNPSLLENERSRLALETRRRQGDSPQPEGGQQTISNF